MLTSILAPLLSSLGAMALRMLVAAMSGPVVEGAILRAIDLLVSKYESKAAATPDSEDDARAAKLKEIVQIWKAALAKQEAKDGITSK